MFLTLAGLADADLINNGNGLIYDTDLNITWLQDANYSRTSGYTTGGLTYDDGIIWLNQIFYAGLDGWRLPSAGSNPQQGYYQTGTELGHLFYDELRIPVGTSSTTPINTGPFLNLDHGFYWLDSQIEPYSGGAWYFVFNTGFMHGTGKDSGANVWAVHDGNVGGLPPGPGPCPVPEPSTLFLLATGLLGIWGFRRRK